MTNNDDSTKQCSRCREVKPLSLFSKNKSQKSGLHNECKVCNAAYRAANREKRRTSASAYYAAHRDRLCASARAHYAAHRDHIRDWQRVYAMAYRKANREKRRASARAYYAAHRDQCLAYSAAYHVTHREHRLAYSAAYAAAHPDIRRAAVQRRRALVKQNGGTFTSKELIAMRAVQDGICVYCLRQLAPRALTIDHVIPLFQGGRHEATNIVLACGKCNRNKGARTPEQWEKRWYW